MWIGKHSAVLTPSPPAKGGAGTVLRFPWMWTQLILRSALVHEKVTCACVLANDDMISFYNTHAPWVKGEYYASKKRWDAFLCTIAPELKTKTTICWVALCSPYVCDITEDAWSLIKIKRVWKQTNADKGSRKDQHSVSVHSKDVQGETHVKLLIEQQTIPSPQMP